MARLDFRDWLLLGTLGPIWLVTIGLTLWFGLTHPGGQPSISVMTAASGGYPVVRTVGTPDTTPIRPGDLLVSIGGVDLADASAIDFLSHYYTALHEGRTAEILYEADGMRATTPMPIGTYTMFWWAGLPFSIALAAAAALALLRARGWHLRRTFFVGSLLWCIGVGSGFAVAGGALTQVGIPFRFITIGLGIGIALVNAFRWTESAGPIPRHWFLASWAVAGGYLIGAVVLLWAPGEPALLGRGTAWFMLAYCGLTLYAYVRTSRRSDAGEQRRIRWVVYGFAIAVVVLGISSTHNLLYPGTQLGGLLMTVSALAAVAVPVGFTVSILFYDYLDIDRVIVATAAAALLLVVLGVGAFAAIPPVADALAGVTGAEPRNAQLILSMALAALLVPGYQLVSKRVGAWLFPAQERLEHGFDQLLDALSRCSGAEELTRTAGESIDRLLQPESIVTYAIEGDAFTPVFVRGRAVPPAFDANSPLITALRAHTTPLVANRFVRSGESELSPFDRAALETLDVATIGPTHRRGNLVAFQCLGSKRSGDIYTASDMALLSAVSSKVGDLLDRFDDEAVLQEARQMQSALRRYVPGAVADELVRGQDLPSGEREVSVFFVDIRGYTRMAEGLQPDEIFSTLNDHTDNVSRIVGGHGGCVVEFSGDGLMAVFGAPQALEDKESCAVAAAREVLTSLARSEITVGIGIATGPAFVGDIQSADRRIWSVIGNTTNLAARLQGLTRNLNAAIAVCADTREAAGAACRGFLLHPDVRIRGRSEALDVFALPLDGAPSESGRLSVVG